MVLATTGKLMQQSDVARMHRDVFPDLGIKNTTVLVALDHCDSRLMKPWEGGLVCLID